MQIDLLLNPAVKEKFRAVLKYLEDYPRPNINVKLISEVENTFTIEYEKPSDLFKLGRAFEPFRLPVVAGSITHNFDNSYINKI